MKREIGWIWGARGLELWGNPSTTLRAMAGFDQIYGQLSALEKPAAFASFSVQNHFSPRS